MEPFSLILGPTVPGAALGLTQSLSPPVLQTPWLLFSEALLALGHFRPPSLTPAAQSRPLSVAPLSLMLGPVAPGCALGLTQSLSPLANQTLPDGTQFGGVPVCPAGHRPLFGTQLGGVPVCPAGH